MGGIRPGDGMGVPVTWMPLAGTLGRVCRSHTQDARAQPRLHRCSASPTPHLEGVSPCSVRGTGHIQFILEPGAWVLQPLLVFPEPLVL